MDAIAICNALSHCDQHIAVTESAPSPFHYAAFRAYFAARLGATMAQIIMVVVIGWQVYDIARATRSISESSFLLGLIGLMQFLPVFLLSLIVGVIVDRIDRRVIARLAILLELVGALVLVWVSATAQQSLWPFFLVATMLGVARAFAQPALSALAPNLVPSSVLPSAIAWSSIGFQAGVILGPVIGGISYDLSPPLAYWLSSAMLALSLVALFLIPPIALPENSGATGLAAVREGLDYLRNNQIVLGAISLDLCAVILAGATAMLPIYARDILHVGPLGLGLLRASPAIGAAVIALWLTQRPLGNKVGIKMFISVGLFTIATAVFGLSTTLWLSVASLIVLGGSDMVSVYVRQSLIQLHTPDAMRGRVSAVSTLFISASNELGEFRAGLVAAAIGPVLATTGGGLMALGATILWAWLFPKLRDADRLEVPEHLQ